MLPKHGKEKDRHRGQRGTPRQALPRARSAREARVGQRAARSQGTLQGPRPSQRQPSIVHRSVRMLQRRKARLPFPNQLWGVLPRAVN